MNSPVKIWRNQKHIAAMLGREGKIISWTIVRVPPSGFSSFAPYPVVIVKLRDNKRMSAQLVDFTDRDLKFGTRVRAVLRRISEPSTEGVIPYGIKVRPI